MHAEAYARFNAGLFTRDRYDAIVRRLTQEYGELGARMCEAPVLVTRRFADETVTAAMALVDEVMREPVCSALGRAVAPPFRLARPPERPSFFIIDFAVARGEEGEAVPRLIELQAFSSNFFFMAGVAQAYIDGYGLGDGWRYRLAAQRSDAYEEALRRNILGSHAPENVVLMEVNPWQQSTRREFVATQRALRIPVVDVREVVKRGRSLYYSDDRGREIPIARIYNRVIPTEFLRLGLAGKTAFDFTDDLEVEWVGDPGWFYRVSKYALPYLKHPSVPRSWFLDQLEDIPPDLENYVLKPVFYNAGLGVKMDVTREDIERVPAERRHDHILMRKVSFLPFVPDAWGGWMNVEVRLMVLWNERPEPLVMMGRVMRTDFTNDGIYGDEAWSGLAPVLVG